MQASIQYCHFLGRAVEEIVASLFNMSRVSCHSVVLSYFVRMGGMQVRPQTTLLTCFCLTPIDCTGWQTGCWQRREAAIFQGGLLRLRGPAVTAKV